MIVTICGHRPPKVGGYTIPNPVYDSIVEKLDRRLMLANPDMVFTGMSLGVEQWAADLCILNDIPFTACIPFHGYDGRWPHSSRVQYNRLLKKAANVVVVTDTNEYSPKHLTSRNRYMATRSDEVWAVWNGSSGGTDNVLQAAKKIKRVIRVIDIPKDIWAMAKEIELTYSAGSSGPKKLPKLQIAEETIQKAASWEPSDEESAKITKMFAAELTVVERAVKEGSPEVTYKQDPNKFEPRRKLDID